MEQASTTAMDDVDDMDIDLGPIDDGEAIQIVSIPRNFDVVVTLITMRRISISPISQIHKIRTTPATNPSHPAPTLTTLPLTRFTFGVWMTLPQRI